MSTLELLSLGCFLALAVVHDVRERRIPNVLTLPMAIAGLFVHTLMHPVAPLVGLRDASLGLLLAGALTLPGWFASFLGAGDVKLISAVGAWVGSVTALKVTLASYLVGGLLALFVALRHRVLGRALRGAAALAARATGSSHVEPALTGVRFPFAVAIAAGTAMGCLWS